MAVPRKGGLAKVTLCVPRWHGHCWFHSPDSGPGCISFSGQTPCQEATGMRVAHLILTGTYFEVFVAFMRLFFLYRKS